MALRFRKQFRVGPFRWHFTQAGYSSWSVKIGPWSWNSRARRHRVDLPGPWAWTQDREKTGGR